MCVRKWFYNESFFEAIDTKAKAYFLGLLMADGNIINTKRSSKQIQITCINSDSYILDMLRNEIGYIKPLTFRERIRNETQTHSCEINLYSVKMYNDLINLGITPKKGALESFVNMTLIPDNLKINFWMGYFDGDGSINKDDGYIVLCFNGETYNIFTEYISPYLDNEIRVLSIKNIDNSILNKVILKKNDSLNFLKKCYENNDYFLTRKKRHI